MRKNIFSVLAGSLVALALISMKAHAAGSESDWGDLGYSDSSPATEIQPLAVTDNDEIASTISSAELASQEPSHVEEVEIKPATQHREITDISSVRNTYGVETEERTPISIYVAPLLGASALVGSDAVSSTPRYAAGVTGGVLLAHNFMIQGSFVHAETNLSNPIYNQTGVLLIGDVYQLKQNIISGGGKFFILGRESRVRPYVGGGLSYARGSLNYSAAYATILGNQGIYKNDLTLNEYMGYGELGAEIAITRTVVANLGFQISGILSSDVGGGSASYDTTRLNVGNSVGRTASYLASAGVGIYF